MSEPLRPVAEVLARVTSRRRWLARGAGGLFALLAGGAAVGLGGRALAGQGTVCQPPYGRICDCQYCQLGVCQKPCVMNTTWYASGCWVTAGVTCCDCTCPAPDGVCGCPSDVCP